MRRRFLGPILSVTSTLLALPPLAYAQGTLPSPNVQLTTPPASVLISTGPYYALIIGNSSYVSYRRLDTPIHDAKALDLLLRTRFGFTTKVLLNATRGDILSALVTFRRTLPPDSNLLIFYAGHGDRDTDEHEAFWLPVNATPDSHVEWISADEITRNARAMPSQHVIVISDSCYSGAINDTVRGVHTSIDPEERDRFLKKVLASKSRTILSSGGDEPVDDAGGDGHSIFAQALLDGLNLMDDEKFTANDLFETYVRRKVGGNALQQPQYAPLAMSGDNGGEFVFSRVSAAGTPTPPARFEAALKLYQSGNFAAALSSFSSLAAAGDVKAMRALAEMYDKGTGVPKSYTEGFDWYHKAADAGDAKAMLEIGRRYMGGKGVVHDSDAAVRWYGKAAKAGDTDAMVAFGLLCCTGAYGPKDRAQSVDWFRKAAELGNVEAMSRIAMAYDEGDGVAKDDAEAARWYSKGAEAGSALAMANLSKKYELGRGVPKDYALASKWAGNAQASNDGKGLFLVALESGDYKKSYYEQLQWLQRAVEAGYVPAMVKIGVLYEYGFGVERNPVTAEFWFKKAADLGDTLGAEELEVVRMPGNPRGLHPASRPTKPKP